MKNKILITGINGFLGRSFTKYIKEDHPKYEVLGICFRSKNKYRDTFTCDLENTKRLRRIISEIKPDYIFNFAGGRYQSSKKMFHSNYLATESLFKAIESIGKYHPRIIIPGTAAEYGPIGKKSALITEEMLPEPLSEYGFIKYLQTSLSLMYARKGLNITVARIFNITGEAVPPSLSIGKFAYDIAFIEKGKRPPILKTWSLDGKRDFLDVKDVCSALWALKDRGLPGNIYNVCSAKAYAIRDLLKKMIALSKAGNIRVEENKSSSSSSFDAVGSNAKLKKTTKWSPKIPLEQSLMRTLEFYRKTVEDENTDCSQ